MGFLGIVLIIVLAAAFGFAGYAKLTDNPQMVGNLNHLGVSAQLRKIIGGLEVAAALGLLIGLFANGLAVAAAVGLVALMIGALVFHLRAGDRGPALAAPAGLGVLSLLLVFVA